MLAYSVPVFLGCFLAWASFYAPLKLPPPFEAASIAFNPVTGTIAPLEGPIAVNSVLQEAELLFVDKIISPETVVFDDDGRMYLFTEKGIYRANPKGESFDDPEIFVQVQGGRPLSGAFDSQGTLYFCDSMLGLGKLNVETKAYEIVLKENVLYFCDDLVVSSEDEIFIADGTTLRVPAPELVLRTSFASAAVGGTDGRLLKYTPSTGAIEILIEDLAFANGVELAHDESYVLASDSGSAYRTRRYWLKGPKKGTTDVFIDSLPGVGDGISRGSNGTYWVAIFARLGFLDSQMFRFRLTRWIGPHIPLSMQEKLISKHSMVLQVDGAGNVLRSFHDPSDVNGRTTSVCEHKGRLYVGSFNRFVQVLDLEKILT